MKQKLKVSKFDFRWLGAIIILIGMIILSVYLRSVSKDRYALEFNNFYTSSFEGYLSKVKANAGVIYLTLNSGKRYDAKLKASKKSHLIFWHIAESGDLVTKEANSSILILSRKGKKYIFESWSE